MNTSIAKAVVEVALQAGTFPSLRNYPDLRREVRYGEDGSRVDFLLTGPPGACYLEAKSVTLVAADGRYAFPDAVAARGLKHLRELAAMVRAGHRAFQLNFRKRLPAPGTGRFAGVTHRSDIGSKSVVNLEARC